MSSPLYQALNRGMPSNMVQQINQFKQNPMAFLQQHNLQIPEQYMQDPKQAVQYLLDSGRMSQADFNRVSQMAQQFGVKLN